METEASKGLFLDFCLLLYLANSPIGNTQQSKAHVYMYYRQNRIYIYTSTYYMGRGPPKLEARVGRTPCPPLGPALVREPHDLQVVPDKKNSTHDCTAIRIVKHKIYALRPSHRAKVTTILKSRRSGAVEVPSYH